VEPGTGAGSSRSTGGSAALTGRSTLFFGGYSGKKDDSFRS
jgi:hypothetical protein